MIGKIIKKYLPNFKISNGWFWIVSVLMLVDFYIEVVTGIDFEILKIKVFVLSFFKNDFFFQVHVDAFKIETC